MEEQTILKYFEETKALQTGHFQLRSGLHSDHYFQAAQVLQHTRIAQELCDAMAEDWKDAQVETVISPAVGGIVVGQGVGLALGVRAIFAEKDDDKNLVLRRGFSLCKGERVLVAEDVVTKGGRVQQTIDLVRSFGAIPVGVTVLVDRSSEPVDFGVPFKSMLKLSLETFEPDQCPLCAKGMPMDHPGSK